MSLLNNQIETLTSELCAVIAVLPVAAQVDALNAVRRALHEAGPFAGEPIDFVEWVPSTNVHANDYNPNKVAPPEMRLLNHSIEMDGYTQPIVVSPSEEIREVVDGFHRTRVGKENKKVHARLQGYLPVTSIRSGREALRDRQAATIRHNRARGVHGVLPMVDIVANLLRLGWNDEEVARELGMDADEVLRFKQTKGLPELFRDEKYSQAWE